jgi:DNA-directed RNA polymerase subunit K/omega
MSALPPGSIIISNPDERITTPILNDFEIVEIIRARATQIENNAPFDERFLEDVTDKKFTSIQVATAELNAGVLDYYKIYRLIGEKTYEEWKVGELKINED